MKTISFVIPVYNEEKRIGNTIKALMGGVYFAGLKLEKVIFVDDGSTDATRSIIKASKSKIEKKHKIKVETVGYEVNRGKGYAIKTGMKASNSDYTLMFDADMSTSLDELKKFLPYFGKGIDVIIGTRKNGHSTVVRHQPLYRELLGRGFTLLSNMILNTWVTDFTCGFKAFSRQAKDRIFENTIVDRWSYDSEIIYLAYNLKFNIKEVAVVWKNDPGTKVNLLKDLPETLSDLFRIRFNKYSQLTVSKEKSLI